MGKTRKRGARDGRLTTLRMRGSIDDKSFSMLLFRITSVMTLRKRSQSNQRNRGGDSDRERERKGKGMGCLLAERGDPLPLGLPGGAAPAGLGRAATAAASPPRPLALLRLPLLRHLISDAPPPIAAAGRNLTLRRAARTGTGSVRWSRCTDGSVALVRLESHRKWPQIAG